jgi:hypothetical protein
MGRLNSASKFNPAPVKSAPLYFKKSGFSRLQNHPSNAKLSETRFKTEIERST